MLNDILIQHHHCCVRGLLWSDRILVFHFFSVLRDSTEVLVEEIKIYLCFHAPGKSALHWAAAVNNVDAAMVLLKNGANKDMQNNKVQQILYEHYSGANV